MSKRTYGDGLSDGFSLAAILFLVVFVAAEWTIHDWTIEQTAEALTGLGKAMGW